MCATCGCSDKGDVQTDGHGHEHGHGDRHEHVPGDADGHGDTYGHEHGRSERVLRLEEQVFARNNLLAERNRGWLEGRGILALNLVSAPGAGKTTLLQRTLGAQVSPRLRVFQTSTLRGDGLDAWYVWLREQMERQ
jgi:hydrogenase nickel incorporation protein HypB